MKFTIGIDPGKSTGVAIYDRQSKKLIALSNENFVSALNLIKTSVAPDDVFACVVEVPRTKANWHKDKSGTTAHNIGRVCREAELMSAMLMDMGYKVITQPPKGKVKANVFKQITGWEGSSNEHTRDAAMLCFDL